jgi:hypothetical protein
MKRFLMLFALLFGAAISTSFSQTVYITQYGDKYHTAACKNVGPASQKITLAQAQTYTKRPCSICKPPTKITSTKKKVVKKKPASAKKPAAAKPKAAKK